MILSSEHPPAGDSQGCVAMYEEGVDRNPSQQHRLQDGAPSIPTCAIVEGDTPVIPQHGPDSHTRLRRVTQCQEGIPSSLPGCCVKRILRIPIADMHGSMELTVLKRGGSVFRGFKLFFRAFATVQNFQVSLAGKIQPDFGWPKNDCQAIGRKFPMLQTLTPVILMTKLQSLDNNTIHYYEGSCLA